MNTNIETMKKAIKNYKDLQTAAAERVKSITDTYGQEAGKREQDRQDKQLKQARATAEKAIREAGSEGLAAAERWGRLDGSRLTDDIKLLDAGLVSAAEFEKLKSRHADNATMLEALRKYGEKQNAAAAAEARANGKKFVMETPYNVWDIPTAEGKQETWRKVQAQAIDMLDMVDGSGRYNDSWTRALGSALAPEAVEHFGEGMDL